MHVQGETIDWLHEAQIPQIVFAVINPTLVLTWQLGWESIVVSIRLSMNDDVKPKLNRPIKNYILTYSYIWLIINVRLVAEGIDYAIIITTLKH